MSEARTFLCSLNCTENSEFLLRLLKARLCLFADRIRYGEIKTELKCISGDSSPRYPWMYMKSPSVE